MLVSNTLIKVVSDGIGTMNHLSEEACPIPGLEKNFLSWMSTGDSKSEVRCRRIGSVPLTRSGRTFDNLAIWGFKRWRAIRSDTYRHCARKFLLAKLVEENATSTGTNPYLKARLQSKPTTRRQRLDSATHDALDVTGMIEELDPTLERHIERSEVQHKEVIDLLGALNSSSD